MAILPFHSGVWNTGLHRVCRVLVSKCDPDTLKFGSGFRRLINLDNGALQHVRGTDYDIVDRSSAALSDGQVGHGIEGGIGGGMRGAFATVPFGRSPSLSHSNADSRSTGTPPISTAALKLYAPLLSVVWPVS